MVERNVGRDSRIGASYTCHDGVQSNANDRFPFWSHDVQLSVEHSWRHSAFRRTAVSFSGGPSLLQQKTIINNVVGIPPEIDLAPGDVIVAETSADAAIEEPAASPNNLTERLFRVVGAGCGGSRRQSHLERAGLVPTRSGRPRCRVLFEHGDARPERPVWPHVSVDVSAGYTDGDVGLGSLLNRYGTTFSRYDFKWRSHDASRCRVSTPSITTTSARAPACLKGGCPGRIGAACE